MNDTGKTLADLRSCCAKVYYDMWNLGLKPGSEDWVRNPESIRELMNLVREVWVEECHGDPSEWPWNQFYVLFEFIRERKKTRAEKDITKSKLESESLFPIQSGTIYFLKNTRGHIKVGWTDGDPMDRRSALQTGESEKLILFASMPGTARQERSLHVRFAAYWTGGGREWFHPVNDLKTFIKDNAECLHSL